MVFNAFFILFGIPLDVAGKGEVWCTGHVGFDMVCLILTGFTSYLRFGKSGAFLTQPALKSNHLPYQWGLCGGSLP